MDDESQKEAVNIVRSYTEGLCWVLLYYYQGCPSWEWYYPYHYAPFASDLINMDSFQPKFELGVPFKLVINKKRGGGVTFNM